jgi:S1-C subfamily serine protease
LIKYVLKLHPQNKALMARKIAMRRIGFLFICVAFLVFGSIAFAGKVYKWVDERGVVHFSDRQPNELEKVKGTLEERDVTESFPSDIKEEPTDDIRLTSPIAKAISATFTIKGSKQLGTGFFISSTGFAVTCRHVIQETGNYTARLNDNTEAPVTIISTSQKYDLALIQVLATQKSPSLPLRPAETLFPGEQVFAVGASAGLQATITDGVFTGFRKIPAMSQEVIQFSAPVNPGNSGGPLIDGNGQVVGVVSVKFLMTKGIPVSGVGFAVPSEQLQQEYGIYLQ